MEFVAGVLVVLFFIMLIALIATAVVLSVAIGFFISIFAAMFSAIKSCVIGIADYVDNKFMRVTMYIAIGLTTLAIVAAVVVSVVLMFIG